MNDPPPHASSRVTARIAVIGGGISGLAAAHRLTELLPNADVTLFEASNRLGGVLDTANIDGFLIERSADNFLTTPVDAVELCRRLDMADQLLPTDETRRRAFVVRKGRLLPIPAGFYLMSPRQFWPLVKSPLLSWSGKLRMLAEPFVSRGGQADESVASFARRRFGREAYERLIQPLVAGIYTADPETLSMAATMPQFLEYERTHGSLLRATLFKRSFNVGTRLGRTGDFRNQSSAHAPTPPHEAKSTDDATGARYALFAAPKLGMKSLVDALADRLHSVTIRLGASVSGILHESGGRWQLNCGLSAANPQSFDGVIVALPAHGVARLMSACDPELAGELAAIPYAGCAVVSLGFARSQIAHPLNGFGFVVPQAERRQIIAASFASLKFPGRAPADCVLIRVFIGGALQPELLQLSDGDLRQLAGEEITDVLDVTGQPLVADVARWPTSMPQYLVGHLKRVARIEELAARWPNLALAGNAYRGVGIPQCIHSGEVAAERIALARQDAAAI